MSGAFPGPTIATLGQIADALQQMIKLQSATYQQIAAGVAILDDLVAGQRATAIASWIAGVNPNNVPIFISPGTFRVVSIVGRLEIAEGGAATVSPVKAPPGTSIATGTALTSTSFNANGTPFADQTLTLTVTTADLLLAPGDCIGLKTTGAWTTSIGSFLVTMVPV